MIRNALSNRTVAGCLAVLALVSLAGVLAPWIAPHEPNAADVINALEPLSMEFPLGTDHLGRCILSRVLFGIRTTLFYSLLTMIVTVFCGTLIGLFSGYMRGRIDALIMRLCDVMLSFPYEVIVLSVVGFLGPGLTNIVVANFVAKLAWYVRMIRSVPSLGINLHAVWMSSSMTSGMTLLSRPESVSRVPWMMQAPVEVCSTEKPRLYLMAAAGNSSGCCTMV